LPTIEVRIRHTAEFQPYAEDFTRLFSLMIGARHLCATAGWLAA
jgi:hypothetical protein